jgi:hypothetical protein
MEYRWFLEFWQSSLPYSFAVFALEYWKEKEYVAVLPDNKKHFENHDFRKKPERLLLLLTELFCRISFLRKGLFFRRE